LYSQDLLNLASKLLRVGGRLVYLLPTNVDFDNDNLPTHPLMRVVSVSEQLLTRVREKEKERESVCVCVCIHSYIHQYIPHTHTYIHTHTHCRCSPGVW
jgi:hypothetical protein